MGQKILEFHGYTPYALYSDEVSIMLLAIGNILVLI